MKRVFVILLLSTMTVCAYSRTNGNGSSDKGYIGKLSASIGADNEVGVRSNITTSHGYSFGQGLWLGGGVGITFAEDTSFPVFSEIKYSFSSEEISPYVDCRIGYQIYNDYWDAFISPSIGVDIASFSVFVSFNSSALRKYVHLGVSWNF